MLSVHHELGAARTASFVPGATRLLLQPVQSVLALPYYCNCKFIYDFYLYYIYHTIIW
jgi:hypothetical protein